MKIITRQKRVMGISLNPSHDDFPVFDALSDTIFELSRNLYRYELVDIKDIDEPLFTNEQIFAQFDLHRPIQEREVDEVWVFGSHLSSSSMGGSKAFRLTESNVEGTEGIHRRFPVMRISDAPLSPLHTFCRRVEATMFHVYREYPYAKNMWEKYTQTARTAVSGVAGCGSPIYPPNGILFGFEKKDSFLSSCDDWLYNYPQMKNRWRYIDASEWGGTQEGYLRWWLHHLPHGVRKTDGVHDNWWHYIMNLDLIR